MCEYIKDDGETCGRTAQPFCHDHEDTAQAKLWKRQDEILERLDEREMAEDSVSGDMSAFEPEWVPTTCDECERAVRPVCARLDEAAFQPQKAIVTMALTCPCGDSVVWDPTTAPIPKSELPDKWLFESDR